MSDDAKVQADRQLILDAKKEGGFEVLKAYTKLSGPGWLQSAITLGGGSLAGSLYLGVIGGYQFMWLQPLMMILGILMLSAIAYVTLSSGEKPFRAINKHVNPVLGWGWLIAAMMANLVWAMPQFSLGAAALQQNLGIIPEGSDGLSAVILFLIAGVVIWFYDAGGKGIKIFDMLLKLMVGVVVVSFFGVVIALSAKGVLPWGEILMNFIPNPSMLSTPADGLQGFINASGDAAYWTDTVVKMQREKMIAAAATAVGINMTFLLPYSMLKRGWGKDFRGLATFDLSTGLFVPFLVATSCVVIAAASQFHGKYDERLVSDTDPTTLSGGAYNDYCKSIKGRLAAGGEDVTSMTNEQIFEASKGLEMGDRQLAASLVNRDAGALALSLKDLVGEGVAQTVFGIGVLGMAVSTIIILMLINGFCLCEALGMEPKGTMHRIGSYMPGFTGALGFLFLWSNSTAKFYLAVPTSVFGMVLLPIAYVTFFLMMNNKSLLGDNMLQGNKRIAMNIGMLIAIAASGLGSLYVLSTKGTGALITFGVFVAAVLLGQMLKKKS